MLASELKDHGGLGVLHSQIAKLRQKGIFEMVFSAFPADRTSALAALSDFLPRIPRYSPERSFVRAGHPNVSRLSPYIRWRLLTEKEVVQATLAAHSFQVAEKFIQEVVWRTYWKGWLELNPSVWDACLAHECSYRSEQAIAPWGETYERACNGETELACFNDWVAELRETGYLHNHARMWFASIWIFTLKIPWQLGAMFMYRHLLDGDPASNTLSWRWVAGLQTKGKSYLAKPDNISFYSEGRWSPKPGDLAGTACTVVDDRVSAAQQMIERPWQDTFDGSYGVLITSEDLSIELEADLMQGAKAISLLRYRVSLDESEEVSSFITNAESDALSRLGARGCGVGDIDELLAWVREAELSHIVIVAPAVGPRATFLNGVASALQAKGIRCSWYRRAWDVQLHGLATKGFFPFWEQIKKRIQAKDPLFHGKLGVK